MDAVTIIVTALAGAAGAGTKDATAEVVKDAYSGLKRLITGRYPSADLTELETHPDDEQRRNVIAQALMGADAGQNLEVVEKATELLALIHRSNPEVLRAIGIDLTEAEIASLDISGVTAIGEGAVGVRAPGLVSTGSVVIRDVRAERPAEKKTTRN